jgi:hypothetical protein
MQNIEIKSGTNAKISIIPKIGGIEATSEQLAGVTIYVFFVYQFTNKIYGNPYKLTSGNLTIDLSPADTIAMLGAAEENQKFEIQFAIKSPDGEVLAEDKDSNLVVNIIRWEAGQWLNQESKE